MTSKTKAHETKSMREGRAQLRASWGAKKTAGVVARCRPLIAEIKQKEAALRTLREGRPLDELRAELRQFLLDACDLTFEQYLKLRAERVAN